MRQGCVSPSSLQRLPALLKVDVTGESLGNLTKMQIGILGSNELPSDMESMGSWPTLTEARVEVSVQK